MSDFNFDAPTGAPQPAERDQDYARRLAEAERLVREGQLDDAQGALVDLYAERPDDPVVINDLGVVQWELGERDEGLRLVLYASRQAPDYREAALNLGQMLAAGDHPENAYRVYRFYAARHPDDTEAAGLARELEPQVGERLALPAGEVVTGRLGAAGQVRLDRRSGQLGGAWRPGAAPDTAELWEPEVVDFVAGLLAQTAQPLLWDAGAGAGCCSLLAAAQPGLTAWALEPNPQVWEILENNLRLNGLAERVRSLQVGLGQDNTRATLYVPSQSQDAARAGLARPAVLGEVREAAVNLWAWDRLARVLGLAGLSVAILDLAGSELAALRGGEVTVRRFQPALLCAWEDEAARGLGYELSEIAALLGAWGYGAPQPLGRRFACFQAL
ncbi:MAG: FkbM family methyltransferase [Deltaproteobacteria bacterium]|nr:FkbM family methyltransferase [Deltaproteobacteria bacterium]